MEEKEKLHYVKLTFTDEEFQKMMEITGGMGLQDFIRVKYLSDGKKNNYSVEEALELARKKHKSGELPEKFSLPDIYGDTWNLQRGYSGVAGKRWWNFIDAGNAEDIVFVGTRSTDRKALYSFKEDLKNEKSIDTESAN